MLSGPWNIPRVARGKHQHFHQNCKDKRIKLTRGNNKSGAAAGSEQVTYILEEFFGNDTGPGINRKFHLTDLLVDLLHEVDDKVHQLVFVHLLRVEVGNQEANIISLK